jgi:putrescine aminotransferase
MTAEVGLTSGRAVRHTDEEIQELVRRHQSTGRALLFSLLRATDVEDSATGSWITGVSGERYLDLGSFAVFLLGHGHPAVVAAVREQLERMAGSSRTLPSRPPSLACAELAALAPEGLSKVMLLNSGAEVVEAAIKLARAGAGRGGLAHLEGSYHGKTAGALSLTDAAGFRRRVGPLLPGVIRLPRDDAGRAAELVLGARPAAVFFEPVQGEGGVRPIAPEVARALRAACDEVGALLVADEIQAGLGRCGTLWAHEPLGVRPDVLLCGKALGGGVMPVSALVATERAYRPFDLDPLLHSSTFGGNPLAAAAVLAALQVIRDERVPERAAAVGAGLRVVLDRLVAAWPALFGRVTGRGAFLGLHGTRPDVTAEMMRAALAERLLLTPCLTAPEVLRFTPSVFLAETELAFVEAALHRAARVAAAETEET